MRLWLSKLASPVQIRICEPSCAQCARQAKQRCRVLTARQHTQLQFAQHSVPPTHTYPSPFCAAALLSAVPFRNHSTAVSLFGATPRP